MPFSTRNVEITGTFGPIRIQLSVPETPGRHPAVLLGHEGIGVNAHLRATAERLAEAGFVAAIPDLYSRDAALEGIPETDLQRAIPLARLSDPQAALAALPEAERENASKVVTWFSGRDTSTYLPDFQTALAWLSQRSEVLPGAVGAVGFSFGGGLVGQMLPKSTLAAAAVFYGPLPAPQVAASIRIPVLGHFAFDDPQVNATILPFAHALAENGVEFGWTRHPGAHHGFFNESRPSHHPEAAAKAWKSTLGFFRRHLVPIDG